MLVVACPLKGLVGLACCAPNCSSSNYNVFQNRELSKERCGGSPASPLLGISMSQPAVYYAKIANI